MDNNSQGSGGLKASLGGLFGGGAPEYSNTELAGVPRKPPVVSPWLRASSRLTQDIRNCNACFAHVLVVSLRVLYLAFSPVYFWFHLGLSEMTTDVVVTVTGMSPLSPYLNVDPRYLVQVSYGCRESVLFLPVVSLNIKNSQRQNVVLMCSRIQTSSSSQLVPVKPEDASNWLSLPSEGPA